MQTPSFDNFTALSRRGNVIPVFRDIIADTETPVTMLMKLRTHPSVFLLESVEGGEKWGRYSFIGTSYHTVFSVRKDEVFITRPAGVETMKHGGDPLNILRNEMSRYRPVEIAGLPRFYGGAVGFLGYDMVRYFERLPENTVDELKTDEAIFILTDTMIVFDNIKHTISVVACARIETDTDLREAYDEAIRKIDDLIALIRKPAPAVTKKRSCLSVATGNGNGVTSNMSPAAFTTIVEKARDYIHAGEAIQVVLSQRFEKKNDLDPVDLYRALRYINPSPYMFYLAFENVTLIGSSPEVMVRTEEGRAELRPIAGTRRRGHSEQDDRALADELLQDPKERAEHYMLVDLGRNDLGRIARIGSVQVTQLLNVERYSHVMHLVSTVQAELAAGKDCYDVVKATFPAGTLTGAPKIRAMEIIEELETSRRGPYGGAVGYFSYSGNMDFCITIRTITVKNGTLYIQTGAGIVADSDPEREYEETVNKAMAMMTAIELAAADFELGDQTQGGRS